MYNNVPVPFAALCNKTRCDTPANGTIFFFFTMAAIFLSIINCCSLRALHQHRHLLFPPETGLVPNLAKCMKPATLKPAQPLSTQAIHTRDENAMLPPPTTSDSLRREREKKKKEKQATLQTATITDKFNTAGLSNCAQKPRHLPLAITSAAI